MTRLSPRLGAKTIAGNAPAERRDSRVLDASAIAPRRESNDDIRQIELKR